MKRTFLSIVFIVFASCLQAQTFMPVGNSSYIGLDKNMLFNAQGRYTITQTGSRQFDVATLFDAVFMPQYLSGFDGTTGNNVVVEVSGLPSGHTQLGAFIGFTTRYFPPKVFKIEAYDVYNDYNNWRTVAEVNDNTNSTYTTQLPSGAFTKLRFTFSKGIVASGPDAGLIGLSELFFVHGEASKAYDGLMVQYSSNGSVGIGTSTPDINYKLNVNGKIRSREIKVESANWPDYVFAKDYDLLSLKETEKQIKEQGHLPGIPSAGEVKANGIDLGGMNAKLLKKIEELTLYLIEMKKENDVERLNTMQLQQIVKEQGHKIKLLYTKLHEKSN